MLKKGKIVFSVQFNKALLMLERDYSFRMSVLFFSIYNNNIIIIMTLFKEDNSVGQVQSSLRSSIKIHTFTIYTLEQPSSK